MKRKFSIKKSGDIDKVFKSKKSVGNKYIVIYFLPNEYDHFRFAISLGKKFGSAVERNLCKRQVRMILLHHVELLNAQHDIVLVIKPLAKQLNYQQLSETIVSLIVKLNLSKIRLLRR